MTSTASGFKLLIVDDNAHNLYSLRQLIGQHLAVEVLEANSGKAALQLCLDHSDIDLIILDIQMPELDGFETASMLKIRKKTRDIPIIFLTAAFKSEEFQQKGYAVGAVDYLLKPIDDNQLINKISTYFRLIEKERNLNLLLERQVAERTAELALANSYLGSIIEQMGEALLVMDAKGIIHRVNPMTCQMLEYQESDLIGMAIGDIFEEADDEQAGAFMGTWLEALIRTGALKDIEARFIKRDGRRIPILFSRSAIRSKTGTISDILCIAKNMSGYTKVQE